MISNFKAPGTMNTIPARASSPTRTSARKRFTTFFFPASTIAVSPVFPVSVACRAIPIAPALKNDSMAREIKKNVMNRIII
ncbi:MAG: hypothetical protein O8C62_08100 [Candidatus Methanoperedens sp.]|nr:hypothetical protein [Candidatus Methanoperedens sp.]